MWPDQEESSLAGDDEVARSSISARMTLKANNKETQKATQPQEATRTISRTS